MKANVQSILENGGGQDTRENPRKTGRCFLATYRPLVQTPAGQQAIERYRLSPFVDGSCRREPDFESPFPSITATCRGGNFAPRLQKSDRIAYLTTKGKYLCSPERGWRLVAILRVLHRFESHDQAAVWYRQQGCPLPSNCIVDGNAPKLFELTNRKPPREVKVRMAGREDDSVRAVRLWDATYQQRVAKWPVFLATEPEFINLTRPPQLGETHMLEIFGQVPATLNPPEITSEQIEGLSRLALTPLL